jgi:hypothetical protein
MPGVYGFVPHPMSCKLFPVDSHVVSTALWADALRGGKVRPLAAVALDYNALRAPPVDRAELDLLNVVVPFGALDDLHRWTPSLLPLALPHQARLFQLPADLLAEDLLAVNRCVLSHGLRAAPC